LYFKSVQQTFTILDDIQNQDTRKKKFNKLLALLFIYKRKDYALDLLNKVRENGSIIYSDTKVKNIEKICRKKINTTIPDFRGKHRVYSFLSSMVSILKPKSWYKCDGEL